MMFKKSIATDASHGCFNDVACNQYNNSLIIQCHGKLPFPVSSFVLIFALERGNSGREERKSRREERKARREERKAKREERKARREERKAREGGMKNAAEGGGITV
jgi:hypothetical protein